MAKHADRKPTAKELTRRGFAPIQHRCPGCTAVFESKFGLKKHRQTACRDG